MYFTKVRRKYLHYHIESQEPKHARMAPLIFADTTQTAQKKLILYFPAKISQKPINTKCTNSMHACQKEEHCPNPWNQGKGGTEKNGFQGGTRPIIIGAELLNVTFGSRKFSCSFQKELVFLPENGPSNWENVNLCKQENWIKWLPKPSEDVMVN